MKKVLILLMCLLFLSGCYDYNIPLNQEAKIYSICAVDSISGSFFLGSGYISSDRYYYFYIEQEGGLVLCKSNASDAIIYETDLLTPKIAISCENFALGINYTVEEFVSRNIKYNLDDSEIHVKSIKLYVPKGTIIKEFKL